MENQTTSKPEKKDKEVKLSRKLNQQELQEKKEREFLKYKNSRTFRMMFYVNLLTIHLIIFYSLAETKKALLLKEDLFIWIKYATPIATSFVHYLLAKGFPLKLNKKGLYLCTITFVFLPVIYFFLDLHRYILNR